MATHVEPGDVPLTAAQRSKVRRLSQYADPAPGEEAGEIALIPYLDIIINILVFVLVSISVIFMSTIDTVPPSVGGGKVRDSVSSKKLNLSVFITDKGIAFKTSGGSIATGCENVGGGLTIPARESPPADESPYDLAAITTCARKLKSARPEFDEETQVTITANPGIEYQHIINVLDALRVDEKGELFPEAFFGVVR
jgi:biopolymer transport protein TolR